MNAKTITGYQINESSLEFYRGRPGVRAADLVETITLYATPEDAVAALAEAKSREVASATLDYRTALAATGRAAEAEELGR